ncbi:MAG: HAD family hydrolase [Methylococcales symbiont of Iophon sp. n. MRB-2018]|nr:MAG: HAD family hydrolase [Methylococcales symbiont of Iophon sp. n. MRB-2018]KAF3979328.1 MAG: HAD family hydrolase [Methylococcales symbiont of Iophon sp. n. MRB-2018]
MSLAIFDLDNTLISDDSDYLWGQFLVDQGIVDKEQYEEANAKFYQDYKEGKLDISAFLHFSLAPLALHKAEKMHQWREQFITEVIKPILLKPAIRLVNKHRFKGDTVMVITATNRFITEPIVKLFGIDNLLATKPEFIDGQYSGNFLGTPCYQEGKVTLLEEWLESSSETLEDSWFYTDSHNDLPLLQRVDNPVAVDPDDKLREYARKNGWSVISLRNNVVTLGTI